MSFVPLIGYCLCKLMLMYTHVGSLIKVGPFNIKSMKRNSLRIIIMSVHPSIAMFVRLITGELTLAKF